MEEKGVAAGSNETGRTEKSAAGNGAVPAAAVDERIAFAVPSATSPRPVPADAPLDHPHLYFNRELSWLDFNWRVIYHALDDRVPLLERVRFLSITSTNLDEFFRKRVGGLKRQAAAGVRALSPDGRTPDEQLVLIRSAVEPLYNTLSDVWSHTLVPLLRDEAGIHIHDYEDLSEAQRQKLHGYFRSQIFPILTPLAVDPGHPFPFISNLSLSLAVVMRHPTRGTVHFARIKVPTSRGRWVPLDEERHYVPIEQVIQHNVHELFRGMTIEHVHPFQITRNADIRRNEEEADDLLEMMSDELRERRFAPVVRLEAGPDMPQSLRRLLMRELSLGPDSVYEAAGLIDHSDCAFFADLDIPAHKFVPWSPVVPTRLLYEGETKDEPDIFSVIRSGDLLVHHPYESFRASVQRFIEEAADDPSVLAIKQTLYRTSEESPIVEALMRAAERGKQVAVLVEVKARFDEENNMEWGRQLENAGVHVTYGLVGLKTHAKTTLVIREEESGLRAYCHIGTGNYNPKTARLYTDIGLLTAEPEIGADAVNLFHYLTGYAPEQHYRKLLVAPRDLRTAFNHLVHQEIERHERHGDGRIIAKMNALDDVKMIQELYRASQAGVKIDLIVRGHCRLRPGLDHFSENIRVISILGRFLEHSRIYYFHNHGDPQVYIGSADWQRRNLEDRVETIVGIDDRPLKARLIRLLRFCLADQRSAWDLHGEGHCVQRRPEAEAKDVGLQELLMRRAWQRTAEADAPWDLA